MPREKCKAHKSLPKTTPPDQNNHENQATVSQILIPFQLNASTADTFVTESHRQPSPPVHPSVVTSHDAQESQRKDSFSSYFLNSPPPSPNEPLRRHPLTLSSKAFSSEIRKGKSLLHKIEKIGQVDGGYDVSPPKQIEDIAQIMTKPATTTTTTKSTTATRESSVRHPLESLPDVPPLSDLQQVITEAILSQLAQYCNFEQIYEYVAKRWKKLRRRDGNYYSSDCRKSIQSNLKVNPNPNYVNLFRKHPSIPGAWTVTRSLIEASSLAHSLPTKHRQSEDDGNLSDNSDHVDQITNTESGPASLSTLQKMITEVIIENNGSANLATILQCLFSRKRSRGKEFTKYGSNHYNWMTTVDPTSLRKTVLCALTKGSHSRLFTKTSIIIPNPSLALSSIDPSLASLSVDGSDLAHLQQIDPSTSGLSWSMGESNPMFGKTAADLAEEAALSDQQLTEAPPDGSILPSLLREKYDMLADLTDLQMLIIESIATSGGTADFDTIHDSVSKRWSQLRRRDGTPYTADCRRAIQASLSNNPSSRPIFKRLSSTSSSQKPLWGLAKRGRECYEMMKEDKEGSTNNSTGTSETSSSTSRDRENENVRDENLTDLQKLIRTIIEANGGSVAFDKITETVSESWSSLRRRDGTSYTSDCRRSVHASLCSNPPTGRVFTRDPNIKGNWQVVPHYASPQWKRDRIVTSSSLTSSTSLSSSSSSGLLHHITASDSSSSIKHSEKIKEEKQQLVTPPPTRGTRQPDQKKVSPKTRNIQYHFDEDYDSDAEDIEEEMEDRSDADDSHDDNDDHGDRRERKKPRVYL